MAWALEWKIDLRHIQPGKPTQNAHMESFHGRLREECLRVSWFTDLFDARNREDGYDDAIPTTSASGLYQEVADNRIGGPAW